MYPLLPLNKHMRSKNNKYQRTNKIRFFESLAVTESQKRFRSLICFPRDATQKYLSHLFHFKHTNSLARARSHTRTLKPAQSKRARADARPAFTDKIYN